MKERHYLKTAFAQTTPVLLAQLKRTNAAQAGPLPYTRRQVQKFLRKIQ